MQKRHNSVEKRCFFMIKRFYRAKVGKMSLKSIVNYKFAYFCGDLRTKGKTGMLHE